MTWTPHLGAWLETDGVQFRVRAPDVESVVLCLEPPYEARHPLRRDQDGYHSSFVAGARAGARYRYELDGRGPFPDPCSRSQPEGVHGPSEVVDPAFDWSDDGCPGLPLERLVTYELHIGAFTPEGTYAAAAEALPYLAGLGVTAVQLLPLADFAGERGWGYDGVSMFAPARCYGRPEGLRRLVDRAHPLYTRGEYIPLEIGGTRAEHSLAFARREGRRYAIAAVTRLPLRLAAHAEAPDGPWGETAIVLPSGLERGLEDALTADRQAPSATTEGAMLSLGAIFQTLPVALLDPIEP